MIKQCGTGIRTGIQKNEIEESRNKPVYLWLADFQHGYHHNSQSPKNAAGTTEHPHFSEDWIRISQYIKKITSKSIFDLNA